MITSPNDNDLLERYAWLLATCPELTIRNTERALQVSKRLEVSNKSGPEEEVKAGIVLSVSYASYSQIDKAVEICDRYIPVAQQYGLVILLLIPLIAMHFTDEVCWTLLDFVTAAVLLLGTGLLCELVIRKVKNINYRVVICILLLAALLIIWIELAVGIFGTPFAGS